MKKFLLVLSVCLLGISSCKKEDTQTVYNEQLEGKEYLRYFNELLDYSIEFYKSGEIRYITKNRPSGTVNAYDNYRYFKWNKDGITGTSIEVTIPADVNIPEHKIKGIVTGDILTFTESPLKGSYNLVLSKK